MISAKSLAFDFGRWPLLACLTMGLLTACIGCQEQSAGALGPDNSTRAVVTTPQADVAKPKTAESRLLALHPGSRASATDTSPVKNASIVKIGSAPDPAISKPPQTKTSPKSEPLTDDQ